MAPRSLLILDQPAAWHSDAARGPSTPSFDLASVPKEVIQRVDGVTFAVRIPKHVYDASAQRLIDFDETAFSKVVLR